MSLIWSDRGPDKMTVPTVFVWLLLGASFAAAAAIAHLAKVGTW